MITLLYAHIWPESGCYTSPQAVFILKYVWTILTLTPPVFFISRHYSKYTLRLDCNQTRSSAHKASLTTSIITSFFFFFFNLEELCEHRQISGSPARHLIHPGIIG